MGRFSDSPHFLLRSFFDGINNTEPIIVPSYEFDWLVKFVSSFDNGDGTRTFDDDPYTTVNTDSSDSNIIFTDYRTNSWNREIYYDPNVVKTFNSYIVAPMVNITTRGGGLIDLFIKEEDIGYLPIKARYVDRVGNEFNFTNPGIGTVEPGENITDIISGVRYTFTFWDKIVSDTFGMFENNRETYFRKDSLYHEWLTLMAKEMMLDELGVDLDIRNYVNTDKMFSYFHNIFKSHNDQDCRVIFDGMKDFVMRAVPEYQRTERFTELCNIFFDQLYQEIFDLMKNIWSLIDPMEVDQRYLGYLSKYYDMFDIDFNGASLLQVREFVRDMIWMIKRKGTYTEFYILWRILTASKNMLNVYERWHRRDVENWPNWPSTISPSCTATWPNFPYFSDTNNTTCVPASAWIDVLYVYRPEYEAPEISGGAGPGWYKRWYPNVYNMDYTAPYKQFCSYGGTQIADYWYHSGGSLWYAEFFHKEGLDHPSIIVWDTATDAVISVSEIESMPNNMIRITIDYPNPGYPNETLAVRISDGGSRSVDNWYATPNSEWMSNINHNLNIAYPIVTAWDHDTQMVISTANFGFIDNNNISVTIDDNEDIFSPDKKIMVMVTDGSIFYPSVWYTDNDGHWCTDIHHNLNIWYPIATVYERSTGNVIQSLNVDFVDSNIIKITMHDVDIPNIVSQFVVRIAKGEQSFNSTTIPGSGSDDLMLSTHYILETDITSEPLTPTAILTKDVWDSMHSYWEYVRPVNRVSNYRILIAPITDMSGKYIQLYEVTSKSKAYLKTLSYVALDLEDGAYIHNQSKNPSTTWNITHNLGDSILLQVFDNDLNEIIPETITFATSTAKLTFAESQSGFAIMRRSSWSSKRPSPILSDVWRFYHLRHQKEVVVHYKYESSTFYSKETTLSGDNYADAEFYDRENNSVTVGTGNYIYTQTSPEKIWNIPHDLFMSGVIMAAYTFDNVRIHPDKYKLVDSISCQVEFENPTSGYIVLYKVGDVSIEDLIEELIVMLSNVTCTIYGRDDNGNKVVVDSGMYVKVYKDDDYYYFDFSTNKDLEYTIVEIDLFDSRGDKLFNTLMSDLYKPLGVDMVFHYRLKIPSV